MGVAATGNRVRWRQCHLIRIGHDGRAVEHAAIRDDLGLNHFVALRQEDLDNRFPGLLDSAVTALEAAPR
jgi:hypothetical protein